MGVIIGVVAGFALVYWGISLGGGTPAAFLDLASLCIVLGGTVASTMVRFKPYQVAQVFRLVGVAVAREGPSVRSLVDLIVELAVAARRRGLLALDEELDRIDDDYLLKGLRMVIDGTDPETVQQVLDTELAYLEERHRIGRELFEHMGAMAPAFGMVGTLIGLIIMLESLNDPSRIGPALAVALITTLYGSLLAHLIFIPISGRLRLKSDEEILIREMMTAGILAIQRGENPQIVREKLESYLAPKARPSLTRASERAAALQGGAEKVATSDVP